MGFTPTDLEYASYSVGGSCVDYAGPYLSPVVTDAVFYGGAFYTTCYSDEGGRENAVVNLDTPAVLDGGAYTHAFGAYGGYAIAVNSLYVYVATYQNNLGGDLYDEFGSRFPPYTGSGSTKDITSWTGVMRKTRSTMAPAGGFSGACGYSLSLKVINAYLETISGAATGTDARIMGLAATDTEVFCADPLNQRIVVLDAVTMAQLRVLTPGDGPMYDIAIAADGNIWARVGTDTVTKYNKTTGDFIINLLAGAYTPDKLGVLPDGKVWVASSDTYQIFIYDPTGQTLLETYGVSGGCVGNNGLVGGKYLGLILGFYRSGTSSYVVWNPVAGQLGVVASKHNDAQSGAIVASVTSMLFLDCPTINAAQDKVYSSLFRFSLDVATNATVLEAATMDPSNALADYRGTWGTVSTIYRQIGGRDFVFETDQSGTRWVIHEIVPGVSRRRPAGLQHFNLYVYAYIWIPPDDGTLAPDPATFSYDPAANAQNFQYFDVDGTRWVLSRRSGTAYVQRIPCAGLDSHNNPIYRWADQVEESVSGLLGSGDTICRFYYDSATDSALLCGTLPAYPTTNGQGAGTVFQYYANWRGLAGSRTLAWTAVPAIPLNDSVMSVEVVGAFVTFGYLVSAHVEFYRVSDGTLVGTLLSSGATGVNDTYIDSVYGHRLTKVSDTSYKMTAEREIGGSALLYDIVVNGTTGRTTRNAVIDLLGADYAPA